MQNTSGFFNSSQLDLSTSRILGVQFLDRSVKICFSGQIPEEKQKYTLQCFQKCEQNSRQKGIWPQIFKKID